MAHKAFLNRIYERADAGNLEAQRCLQEISAISGGRDMPGYWVCDEYIPPSPSEVLRTQQRCEEARQRLRARISQLLQ